MPHILSILYMYILIYTHVYVRKHICMYQGRIQTLSRTGGAKNGRKRAQWLQLGQFSTFLALFLINFVVHVSLSLDQG